MKAVTFLRYLLPVPLCVTATREGWIRLLDFVTYLLITMGASCVVINTILLNKLTFHALGVLLLVGYCYILAYRLQWFGMLYVKKRYL